MTLEDTIRDAVAAAVAPLAAEVRRLSGELASLRAALPAQLVSPGEAARALGVSLSTVKRGIKDGSIPTRAVGRRRKVDLVAASRAYSQADVAAGVARLAELR